MSQAEVLQQLSVTLLLMFVGALGAGVLPYFLSVRESQLDAMGALGGGLLVGTALAVIIPEGFHAFAEAAAGAHAQDGHAVHDHDHDHEHGGPPEALAGLVLVAGFLAMLLIDRLQHGSRGHGHPHHHHQPASAGTEAAGAPGSSSGKRGAQPGAGEASMAEGQAEEPGSGGSGAGGKAKAAAAVGGGSVGGGAACAAVGGSAPERAILGLIIHCMADGLAMGVAALSGNAQLSALIGMAMVLHKAPMAFGLGTYLLMERWPWARAQRTIIVFSLTAPASTLVTYLLLGAMPLFASPAAVALALLFSGGTFLYAATMHILPEVLGEHAGAPALAAVAVGGLAPVLLSWGHHH